MRKFTPNSPHSPQIHPKIHPADYGQTEDIFVYVGLHDAMRRIYLFEVGFWWGLSVRSVFVVALVSQMRDTNKEPAFLRFSCKHKKQDSRLLFLESAVLLLNFCFRQNTRQNVRSSMRVLRFRAGFATHLRW